MELFRLLGKIIVDNAEARKALQDVSNEGGKTESKLSKVFSGMGKAAAVAGKAIATGLAVGATAMAGLTVKALQSAGDLEQNMGGAEAVFGELGKTIGDMKTPMQIFNAETGKVETQMTSLENVSKQAFQNMGLSQSDYLATANKMGALFKGAGFETQEALDLSSQAMQRAADVASIMGIDTEAAMEAVAGAAKGNFTMMDNLGVAMNDTAIGAYALEKGINKTTAEMSQQEKIGLAMEMFLDKTSYAAGNYAKENATLAGSLGTAKAALTNFLAGSGDVESLVSSFSNLANVVVKSISEIAPRLTKGLSDLVQQVVPLIPPLLNQLLPVLVEGATTLIGGLVSAMPGIIQAIMNVLPALIDGVLQLITQLTQALPQIIDPIIGALPQIIEAILQALPTLVPALIDAVVNIILMLVEMLPQIIQPIIDNLPMIIASIVTALLNNLPALIMGAIQLVMGLVAALPQIFAALIQAIPLIFQGIWESIKNVFAPVGEWFSNMWNSLGKVPGLSSLKTMIENVWKAIKDYITTYINAVKNIVTTVWNSIKNVISTVLNSIKNVIQTAWNAVKTIISNVMKLISSVLKGDWEGVKSAISNILNAIKSVISSIWNGIKNTISSVLNGIKNVVSSIWNGIKSVISSALNGIKTIVSSVWNGIKGAISGFVNGIKTTVSKGFNDVKDKVINAFKNLPSKLKSIGKDLISGLWNGISDKFSWLTDKIKGFAKNVTDKIKGFFGIKSPSRVFRDEIGKQLAEGLAVGIEDNSKVAESASEDMAKKTLEAAQKKLDNYKAYNDLTLADETAFWDSVRKQCTEGTEARIEADKKYLETKKTLNAEILAAEEELQSSLGEINQKIVDRTNEVANSFKLFDSGIVEESELTTSDMMHNLQAQLSSLSSWEYQLDILKGRIGEGALYEEIKGMGVGALNQLKTLNSMNENEIKQYTDIYEQKRKLANYAATKDLQAEIEADKEKAFKTYGETLKGLGVVIESYSPELQSEAASVFERVRNRIAEKMTLSVDNVHEALAEIKQAFKDFNIGHTQPLSVDNVRAFLSTFYGDSILAKLSVEPTIFGYDVANGKQLGAGASGTEVVAGSSALSNTISSIMASQNSLLSKILKAIIVMDENMGGNLKDALENTSFKVGEREFARLVKAVN